MPLALAFFPIARLMAIDEKEEVAKICVHLSEPAKKELSRNSSMTSTGEVER